MYTRLAIQLESGSAGLSVFKYSERMSVGSSLESSPIQFTPPDPTRRDPTRRDCVNFALALRFAIFFTDSSHTSEVINKPAVEER